LAPSPGCAKRPARPGTGEASELNWYKLMSQHRSLRAAAALGAKRNVLKRFERIELLKKRGEWKPGDRVVSLRKTKPPV